MFLNKYKYTCSNRVLLSTVPSSLTLHYRIIVIDYNRIIVIYAFFGIDFNSLMQYNDLSTIRTMYNKFCFVTLCYKLLSKKDEIKGLFST